MSPNKKEGVTPRLRSSDRGLLDHWSRDKLLRVRHLIERALELLEAGAGEPQVVAELRTIIAEVGAELARSEGSPRESAE